MTGGFFVSEQRGRAGIDVMKLGRKGVKGLDGGEVGGCGLTSRDPSIKRQKGRRQASFVGNG